MWTAVALFARTIFRAVWRTRWSRRQAVETRAEMRGALRRHARAATLLIRDACHRCHESLDDSEPDESFAAQMRAWLRPPALRLVKLGRAMPQLDDAQIAAQVESFGRQVLEAVDHLHDAAEDPAPEPVEDLAGFFRDLCGEGEASESRYTTDRLGLCSSFRGIGTSRPTDSGDR